MPFHFEYEYKTRSRRKIRRIVEALHQHASTLDFHRVDDLLESESDDFESEEDQCFIQGYASRWLIHPDEHRLVLPEFFVGFSAFVDQIHRSAFGLGIYPGRTELENGKKVLTEIPKCSWRSNLMVERLDRPDHGRRLMESMLDFAEGLGLSVESKDEPLYVNPSDIELPTERSTTVIGNQVITRMLGVQLRSSFEIVGGQPGQVGFRLHGPILESAEDGEDGS